MPDWRRLDDDPASHGKRHVHGIRSCGTGYRPACGLQQRNHFLGSDQGAGRPGLRSAVFAPAQLGGLAPDPHDAGPVAERISPVASLTARTIVADDVCTDAMKSLSDCRLYTFIDTAYLKGRSPAIVADQLCLGGA